MTYVAPPFALGAPAFTTAGTNNGAHIPALLAVLYLVIAIGLVAAVIWGSSKRTPPGRDPGEGHGRGRGPKRPKPELPLGPRGGIPLDDSVPARVRLRGPGRLAEMLPARPRRKVNEPNRRPVRESSPASAGH